MTKRKSNVIEISSTEQKRIRKQAQEAVRLHALDVHRAKQIKRALWGAAAVFAALIAFRLFLVFGQ